MRICENGLIRDFRPEELEDLKKQQVENSETEQPMEERLNSLETTVDDMILLMADLIGGK